MNITFTDPFSELKIVLTGEVWSNGDKWVGALTANPRTSTTLPLPESFQTKDEAISWVREQAHKVQSHAQNVRHSLEIAAKTKEQVDLT